VGAYACATILQINQSKGLFTLLLTFSW